MPKIDNRKRYREDHHSWRGGKYINDGGYVMVSNHNHPRTQQNGYIREHILIAEKVLGKPLPAGVQIHHWEKKDDNSKIIICQDQSYHYLIHSKEKALKECGNTKLRQCKFCREYDDTKNLHRKRYKDKKGHTGGWNSYHMACVRKYDRERYRKQNDKTA